MKSHKNEIIAVAILMAAAWCFCRNPETGEDTDEKMLPHLYSKDQG